ncbi:glycosyltransferase family 4 protein [Pseudonocardia cypriaca]|nr:glycosyltransferase family 4 protein [Pseudonocardia cypriaca]
MTKVLMVSTSMRTRGGVASYVRMLRGTPLWERWLVEHIASHRDGSRTVKVAVFARALGQYVVALLLRRPDLVHLHMASYGSFARKAGLFWLAWALRVPAVVHLHGAEFHLFHAGLPRPLRAVVRATLTRAAVVVALGDRWARELALIAPAARVVPVPNAVPVPVAAARPPDAPPHAVFLGEIGERKGAFVLIEAWARLAPGTRLTLAGDGAVERARRVVAEHGLEGSVQVRSWLPPDQVGELLAGADVLVLPSRNEGQPMAVLEAMAHGLCVVASEVGGIPELVDDGRTGLLVPPDDVEALAAALRKVLADAGLRAALGAAARERALREFDVDVVWRRIDAIYQGVAGR